jgi:SHS2 domain-containing protein
MPYKYLEDIGTADIAFEATGRDLAELFTSTADATMNVMIENLDTIEPRETRRIELKNDAIDMLLFDFLQELIYFKDADRLLLRVREIRIDKGDGACSLKATTAGDVKAVTLHDFRVEKTEGGWKAVAILDI